jgi:hypothetical protein
MPPCAQSAAAAGYHHPQEEDRKHRRRLSHQLCGCAERRGEGFNPDKFANTWFVKFMHMLGRGIPKENVREIFDRVSFVCI